MWHWDQGHLAYFQFDDLKRIAMFVTNHNFKATTKAVVSASVGLPFAAPATHSPWRNYSRALKLCLLVSEVGGLAVPTPVAAILSKPGAVTCDEFLYFLVTAFSDPSPALKNWNPKYKFRYPLLFALKYLLTKVAINLEPFASFDELIGAYVKTGFVGDEDASRFIAAVAARKTYDAIGKAVSSDPRRQARESLQVMSQISFLQVRKGRIEVALAAEDAHSIFEDLAPIIGPRAADREGEIRRLADLFKDGSTSDVFDYPNTIVSNLEASGFSEGSKVKRTHLVIERNASLRRDFFATFSSPSCDVCTLNTKKTYPWADRVLDIHHLLPLSSGTRVEKEETTFKDLVAVCPTCHRAVHRFYDQWLKDKKQLDFVSRDEASMVYKTLKMSFPGIIHA